MIGKINFLETPIQWLVWKPEWPVVMLLMRHPCFLGKGSAMLGIQDTNYKHKGGKQLVALANLQASGRPTFQIKIFQSIDEGGRSSLSLFLKAKYPLVPSL